MADEYTPSIGVEAPAVRSVDFDEAYGEQKKAIEKGFGVVNEVGNSLLNQEAENAAANDISDGTFKPLPELSPMAKNYNKVGQDMELSQTRMNLEAAATKFKSTLLQNKTDSGMPWDQTDANSFNQQMSDYYNGISPNLSPQTKAIAKSYADYYTNQGVADIQNKISDQTSKMMSYGASKNIDNLLDNADSSMQQGDYNGAIAWGKHALDAANDPSLVNLVGPETAAAYGQKTRQRIAMTLGAGLGQHGATADAADEQIKNFAQVLNFDSLDLHAAGSAYKSSIDQTTNMQLTALGNYQSIYKDAENKLKSGVVPDNDSVNSLLNVQSIAKKMNAKTDVGGLVLATNTAQKMLNNSPAQNQAIISGLYNDGIKEQDTQKINASNYLQSFLASNVKLRANDPALAAMQYPEVQQSVNNLQSNAGINAVSGVGAPQNPGDVYLTVLNAQKARGFSTLGVFTNQQSQSLINTITQQKDFASGSAYLNGLLSTMHPETVPYAKSDLARNGLNPSYLYAQGMPENSGVKNIFNYAMSQQYDKDGKPNSPNFPDTKSWDSLKGFVSDAMSDYKQALVSGKSTLNSAVSASNMYDAENKLAAGYVDKLNLSPTEAAKRAVNDIFASKYNVQSNIIVPKQYNPDNTAYNLFQARYDLASKYNNDPVAYAQVMNSTFALNEGEDGYVLLSNGAPLAYPGTTKPYTINLSDLQQSAKDKFTNQLKNSLNVSQNPDSQQYGTDNLLDISGSIRDTLQDKQNQRVKDPF